MPSDSSVLTWYVDLVEDETKAYLHRDEVPTELDRILAYRVVGRYLSSLRGLGQLDDTLSVDRAIKSITEGDTSLTYALSDSESPDERLTSLLSSMMTYGELEIKGFRRLLW